jgi:hypothetical protein
VCAVQVVGLAGVLFGNDLGVTGWGERVAPMVVADLQRVWHVPGVDVA